MAFQSRGAWTSRPNNAVKVRFKQKHLTWHYPGFGTDSVKTASWSHDRCLSQIDTWEKQHQARGSKNIEYNYFACAHGYLIEGRGNRQNGSNGTSASNRRGQSVQVLIGDNEPLTPGHRAAMREAVARIEGLHKGSTRTQYGHRHWVGTRCPGPYVMGEIPVRAGASVPAVPSGGASVPAPKPAAKPKPSTSKAPAFPLPRRKGAMYYYGPTSGPKTSVSGRTRNSGAPGDVVLQGGRWYSKGLKMWQQRMLDRGWSGIGVADGRYGPKTERVVRQFQKSKGLGVDGKIGPGTWAAAWTEPVT